MITKIIDVKWIAELEHAPTEHIRLSSGAHSHDFFQVVYVTNGEGYIYIDDNMYFMEKNSICVISPDIKHSYETKAGMVTIESKFYLNDKELRESLTGCNPIIHFNGDYLNNLFKAAIKEYNLTKIYKSHMLSAMMYQILIEVIRTDIVIETALLTPEKDERIQKIEKYINKHLFENITLSELAREVYMNRNTFLKFYKEHFGLTPIKHINKMRMSRAKDLLLYSEWTVTQIAERCGYSSVHHFSKRFKEEKNLSPQEYRDKKKNSFIEGK